MVKSKAIQNFLTLAASPLARLYNPKMEVQVNVIDNPNYEKTSKGIIYTDGIDKWYNFRLRSEVSDGEATFNLMKYAAGIGLTGWNFVDKQTHWIGFDFDSIHNHKQGLTDESLQDLISELIKFPYLSIYRSTSGKGIHLYVHFSSPVKTEQRTEHSALAKAMLSVLTVMTGVNLRGSVDVLGEVLWVWNLKQEGTNGLTCIKEGEPFPIDKVPTNWKDNVSIVTTNKRKKESPELEEVINTSKSSDLDSAHKQLLVWLFHNSKYSWWFDDDIKMLVCHTIDLKRAKEDLFLEGLYDTDSSGSSSQNCFAFPLKSGSWIVRRFGKNTAECKAWTTEGEWTKCIFNAKPTFDELCSYYGGLLDQKGGYIFENFTEVNKVLLKLGIEYTPPIRITFLEVKVKYKGGRLTLSIEFNEKVEGWILVRKNIEKTFLIEINSYEPIKISLDENVRFTVSQGNAAGWYAKLNGIWTLVPKSEAKDLIIALNPDIGSDLAANMGTLIQSPFTLVNRPFQDEYLGNRLWNKDAPQLAFTSESGEHPTWDSIFNHLGQDLDAAVQENEWCREYGIITGSQFLLYWVASCIRRPEIALPYLFFWSLAQDTGKSSLHEALRLLLKDEKGYVRAEHSLTSGSGFNGELRGAVICVVEELDLKKNNTAYEKIKDWVTSPNLSIREMYKNAYHCDNTTHWIQTANDPYYCPIMDGDTRVIITQVYKLQSMMPRHIFQSKLIKEAGCFINTIKSLDLPPPHSRIGLPCLSSSTKREVVKSNLTDLESYIEESIYEVKGKTILWTDFVSSFKLWLMGKGYKTNYTDHKIALMFKASGNIEKGRSKDGKIYIVNASFTREENEGEVILTKNGKIV